MAGLLALLWGALPAQAGDAPCRSLTHDGTPYTLCEVMAGQDVRVFHTGPDGRPYGSFAAVDAALAQQGARLSFAMNAGMYHRDRSPVGLLIEDGVARGDLVTTDGPGNFGLLPNGVFCVTASGQFRVIETRAFARAQPDCRAASQSGPMLVIDGALHPRFKPASDSLYIRNGVGVSADGRRAVFAISDRAVNFATFARLFRDGLGLPQALYFDGSVSRLMAPGLGRHDGGLPMGPIVGLVEPAPG